MISLLLLMLLLLLLLVNLVLLLLTKLLLLKQSASLQLLALVILLACAQVTICLKFLPGERGFSRVGFPEGRLGTSNGQTPRLSIRLMVGVFVGYSGI